MFYAYLPIYGRIHAVYLIGVIIFLVSFLLHNYYMTNSTVTTYLIWIPINI